MQTPTQPPRAARGFTLIELLTVIAIIGILAAIIIPTVGSVRNSAKSAKCVANLRSIATAVSLYTGDQRGNYPESFARVGGASLYFTEIIAPYVVSGLGDASGANRDTHRRRVAEIMRCPSGLRDQVDGNDTRSTYSANPQLMPDRNSAAFSTVPLTNASSIRRPSQVILLADGGQTGEGDPTRTHAWPSLRGAIFVPASGGTSLNNPENADDSHANLTRSDGDTANAFFRYRHNDSVNCALADGSVRTFKKGSIQNRHVTIAY